MTATERSRTFQNSGERAPAPREYRPRPNPHGLLGYRASFRFRWQRIGPWNILALNLGVVSARVWLRAASWSNKNRAHRTPGTPRYCSNNQAARAIHYAKAFCSAVLTNGGPVDAANAPKRQSAFQSSGMARRPMPSSFKAPCSLRGVFAVVAKTSALPWLTFG